MAECCGWPRPFVHRMSGFCLSRAGVCAVWMPGPPQGSELVARKLPGCLQARVMGCFCPFRLCVWSGVLGGAGESGLLVSVASCAVWGLEEGLKMGWGALFGALHGGGCVLRRHALPVCAHLLSITHAIDA